MTTMNLRTRSYGSKAMKNAKKAEPLPDYSVHLESPLCNEEIEELYKKVTDETGIYFNQTEAIRQLIQCLDKQEKQNQYIIKICFWYLKLPSASSLKSVIASCLNKVTNPRLFTEAFQDLIQVNLNTDEIVNIVARCFENCSPALEAVKKDLQDLYHTFVSQLNSSKDSGPLARVILSLESQGQCQNDELLHAILKHFSDENMLSDIKSNLALIWTYELKSKIPEFHHELFEALQNRDSQVTPYVPESESWLRTIVTAVVTLGDKSLLMPLNEEKLRLEFLYDIINEDSDVDSVTAYIKSVGVLQCSSKHLSFKKNLQENHEELNLKLIKKYEIYALTNLNFSIDRVRYNAKNVLENVLALHQRENIKEIIENVMKMSWDSKSKSIALNALAKNHVELLTKMYPDLSSKVIDLLQDPTVESCATDLYENLTKRSYDKSKIDSWIHQWIRPLLDLADEESISVMRLLKTSLKINSEAVVKSVLKVSDQKPNLALVCLKLDRINGGQNWKQFMQVIENSTQHFEDSVRIQAMDVLISSHSSKEDFDQHELEILEKVIKLNMVLQNSSDRQTMITLFRKMTLRIKAANPALPKYQEFIQELFSHLMQCFFQDSSFSRRSIALECLQNCILHFDDIIIAQKTEENAKILVNCFHDSFERNKAVALEILKFFPLEATKLNDEETVQKTLEFTLELTRSVKPPDSISAGYFIKYLSLAPHLSKVQILETLLSELELQKSQAQVDLGAASLKTPMYGVLYCIRSLVLELDLEGLPMTKNLFDLCMTISDIIAPVLKSDSPEGFVFEDGQATKVTAQILLLCAWRTSKEISLILGHLSQNPELMKEISDLFVNQLSEIKHRGAFEQAFIGFCQLCSNMWQNPGTKEIPLKMLSETLEDLKVDQNKFCATRRSAGVPYLIQAVVTTEPLESDYKCLKMALKQLIILSRDERAEVRIHAYNILRVLYRDSTLGEIVSPFVTDGLKAAILGFKATSWSERNAATLLFSSLCTRIFGVKRTKLELSKKNAMQARMFFNRYPKMYPFLLNEMSEVAEIMQKSTNALKPEESALYPCLILLAKLQPTVAINGSSEDLKYQLLEFLEPLQIISGSAILKVRELAALAISSILSKKQGSHRFCLEHFVLESLLKDGELSHNQCHGRILQLLYCIKFHEDPQNLRHELANVTPQLTSLFHFLLEKNRCAVIRTTVLEVALALTQVGLHLNGLSTCPNKVQNEIWTDQEEKMQSQFQLLQQHPTMFDVTADDIPRSPDAREAFFKAIAKDSQRLAGLKWSDEDNLLALLKTEKHPGSLSALIVMLLEASCPFSEKATEALLAFVIALLESGKVMNERLRGLLIHYSGALLANHSCQVKLQASTELISQWIRMFTNFLDQPSNGIEVRIGLCLAIEANRKKIFPCTEAKADHEKALHHSLIYGLLKLIIDDDYDVRKLIGNILPQQKAPLLMFEELLRKLTGDKQYASILEKLERELNKVTLEDALEDELLGLNEDAAFDKSETNAWREDSQLLLLLQKSTSSFNS